MALGTRMFGIVALAGMAVFLATTAAYAVPVTVTTSTNQIQAGVDNQGWWSSTATNNNSTNDNYFTQNEDFRSFFSFDLSGISGTVTSATLEVRRYNQIRSPLTLGLFDVTTPAATLITTRQDISSPVIFADLGSGISYGTFEVVTGASTDILSFALDAAAVSDINRHVGIDFFSIGAVVLLSNGGSIFGASNDEPGNTGGQLNSVQRLVLDVSPVPEPATLFLFGTTAAGLGLARWRQRRRKQQPY